MSDEGDNSHYRNEVYEDWTDNLIVNTDLTYIGCRNVCKREHSLIIVSVSYK